MREYYIERTRALMADREMLDSVLKVINIGGIESFLVLNTTEEIETSTQKRERFYKKISAILLPDNCPRIDPMIKKLQKRFRYFDSVVAADLFDFAEEAEMKDRLLLRKQQVFSVEAQPGASRVSEKPEQDSSQDSETFSKTPTPTSDSEKPSPPALAFSESKQLEPVSGI